MKEVKVSKQIENKIKDFEEKVDENFIELYKKLNIIKINKDGSLEVKGNVNFSGLSLKEIPFNFKKIIGDFDVSDNQLTSLKNCPEIVEGNLFINNNKLVSLEGCSNKIDGLFDCSYNLLENFKGGPEKVNYTYFCEENQITELIGLPKLIGEDLVISKSEFYDIKSIKAICKVKKSIEILISKKSK